MPIVRTVGENQPFGIDFRADLAANGRLVSLDVIEVLSGPEGGIEISDAEEDLGVDRGQAKCKIELVMAGKYTIGVEVTYDDSDGGGTAYGVVTLIARAA